MVGLSEVEVARIGVAVVLRHKPLFNTSSFCVVLKGSQLTASPSHCETVETQPRSQREQGS